MFIERCTTVGRAARQVIVALGMWETRAGLAGGALGACGACMDEVPHAIAYGKLRGWLLEG